jgi:hypothetical protein
VLNATIASYSRFFNASEPIVQLTPTQISDQIGRQDTWGSTRTVTGYIEGARVTVVNGGATTVALPLSGTEVGTTYAGTRSGWANAARGASTHAAATAWPTPAAATPTTLLAIAGPAPVAP